MYFDSYYLLKNPGADGSKRAPNPAEPMTRLNHFLKPRRVRHCRQMTVQDGQLFNDKS